MRLLAKRAYFRAVPLVPSPFAVFALGQAERAKRIQIRCVANGKLVRVLHGVNGYVYNRARRVIVLAFRERNGDGVLARVG